VPAFFMPDVSSLRAKRTISIPLLQQGKWNVIPKLHLKAAFNVSLTGPCLWHLSCTGNCPAVALVEISCLSGLAVRKNAGA
jgi:hypothetical protein